MDARFNVDDLPVTGETGISQQTGEIFTTPLVERTWALFENCRMAGAIGVLQGPSGTGKSSALKAIISRFGEAGFEGNIHLQRCCQASGPTSGVRGLMVSLGIGGSIASNRSAMGLQYMLRLAVREIVQKDVRAILLDDADYLAVDSLCGLISLFDHLREANHRATVLMSGVKDSDAWIGQLPAASTRTLHVVHSEQMDLALTAAVLKKMGASLERLIIAFTKGDKDARKCLQLIQNRTNGNFRRVQFFADLILGKSHGAIKAEMVEAILDQMQS